MVVSTAEQPRDTYQIWVLFGYPGDGGPQRALAIPTPVAQLLISVYTILLSILVSQLWSIVSGTLAAGNIKPGEKLRSYFLLVIPVLWSKKAEPFATMAEIISLLRVEAKPSGSRANEIEPTPRSRLSLLGVLVLVFAAWIGGTALKILVPQELVLGNVAPVRPGAIYVPSVDGATSNTATDAARGALEAQRAFRALAGAQVARDVTRHKVTVTKTELAPTADNEPVQRLDYSYAVTGIDLGLQSSPGLAVTVTGSCVTEYGWHQSTTSLNVGSAVAIVDSYNVFGQSVTVSELDGTAPVALFRLSGAPTQGTLDGSNTTWAAVVSSINRTSFSPSTDPWYYTEASTSSSVNAGYDIKPARPVLSCWQDDVWSYKGHISTVDALDTLPGLPLSADMQNVISLGLDWPIVVNVGVLLGPSALLSATTSLGKVFDAGSSSVQADFERLILAAYISTTNLLTDTTLYPADASHAVANEVQDSQGNVKAGVADFVVWSSDVTAVSLSVLIVVPCLLVVVWATASLLLHFSPLLWVRLLDPSRMFLYLMEQGAVLKEEKDKSTSKWTSSPESQPPSGPHSQGHTRGGDNDAIRMSRKGEDGD